MTLANWEITKSNINLTCAIENNRLKCDNDVIKGTVTEGWMHLRLNSDFNRGFTIGKIRTKLEITDFRAQIGSNEGMYGILCMMSASDLTGGTGSAYGFGLRNDLDLQWLLVKFNSGLEHYGSGVILGAVDDTLTPAVDTNYCLELQWCYHELIAGCNLIAKVGLAENNYTDLVTVYDVTDTSSPLTTSVGEGLFFADMDSTVNDLKRCYFDDTEIIQLSGIPL